MIRAGRSHRVYTLSDLARLEGRSLGTYKNKRLNKRPGHPEPISSDKARVLLYDAEQVDAFRDGRSVPLLSTQDSPDDLLDQHEAAALVGVAPKSWETYRTDPALAQHVVLVRGQQPADFAGVEHWPRSVILDWDSSRPGRGHGGGRKTGSRDAVPRGEILTRVAALLDQQSDITADQVHQQLGIHVDRAHRAISQLRAARVRDLLADEPDLTATEVSTRLGYRIRTAQSALATARAQIRGATHTPYLRTVLAALTEAGLSTRADPDIDVRPGGICTAGIPLRDGASLIWDERYGWRTDPQPTPSAGKEPTPPTGPGIRYLGQSTTPAGRDVVALLRDRRTGSRKPRIMDDTPL